MDYARENAGENGDLFREDMLQEETTLEEDDMFQADGIDHWIESVNTDNKIIKAKASPSVYKVSWWTWGSFVVGSYRTLFCMIAAPTQLANSPVSFYEEMGFRRSTFRPSTEVSISGNNEPVVHHRHPIVEDDPSNRSSSNTC